MSKAKAEEHLLPRGVEAAMDHFRYTAAFITSTALALFGSFQFGWASGVINTPQKVIQKQLDLSDTKWAVFIALFPIGGLIGTQIAGRLADSFGRKYFLLWSSLSFIVSGGLQLIAGYVADHQGAAYATLCVSRVLVGVGAGGASLVVPLYLSEISPTTIRGAMGCLNQFAVVTAILASQLVGLGLSTKAGWKWMFAIAGFLGVLQLVVGTLIVESPRWLAARDKKEEAHKVLLSLRGYSTSDADEELRQIVRDSQSSTTAPGLRALWQDRTLRLPLLIAVVLCIAQQFSGINAVFYYSTGFFKSVGVSNAVLGTILASVVNFLATGLGVYLIDRTGRRPLLLSGSGGMCIFAVCLTVALVLRSHFDSIKTAMGFVAIVCVMLFVTFFEIGLGAIPWMIGGEIFPEGPRATAMSVAAALNWIANAIVGVVFPVMNNALKDFSFVPFAVVLFLAFVFTYVLVPETRGRTVEDILQTFKRGGSSIEAVPEERTPLHDQAGSVGEFNDTEYSDGSLNPL